ncbi:MAG: DUF2384 domain-containing protein [Acidobacteria bacterium]|nr:DUF2384 domain-containing protein [Acidobacteriota bacterium]
MPACQLSLGIGSVSRRSTTALAQSGPARAISGSAPQRLDAGNLPPHDEQMPDSLTDAAVPLPTAFLTAEQLGGRRTIGRQVRSDAELASAVEQGLPTAAIDALRKRGVTERDIAALIIKPRTLSHRRAQRSRLTVEESDRAVRLARVRALAEETFADTRKADLWLHRELAVLDGRRPIDLVQTQVGARMVEDLLASIAWGAAV